ncbi:collagen alpha-1(XII) chain-like [Branchiostoma floridae]|uniref:Collagen alpha-1(XII) chain-like n=1 Tax=Branchiostoma floridae TaxID=7739 RepID=A0A9J7N543_BRAFL|nr:collagen alpha-1(XII) chain-like [Branchiostoma floridae]
MLWKLLLPTLLMFVAIRETIGQDYYGEGDYGDGDPLVGLDPLAGDGGFTGGAGGAGGDAGAGDTVDPNPPTPAPEPNPPTPAPEPNPPTPAPEPDPFANRPVLPDGPGPACSMDVVLIVDESSSMSVSWFDRVKQFLVDFIGCFSFHHDVWIGVIPYECVPRTYFPLSPPFGSFIFDHLMKKGGLSRPGVAIRFMKDTTSFRDGVPSAAVVITDGSAQSDSEGQVQDDYAAQAAEARDAGIQLYAVSVGDEVDDAALQAIAGSSDRVFDSDIPCKVAFRILADLCTLSGVPGCVSFEGDSILPLGTSYQPETDGCITCTCSDDGHMMCSGVGCPLRYPPCSNEVNIAGRCCPDCVDDGPVPVGCWYNDILIPIGIEYKPNDCMTCTCPAPGEEP